MSEKGQTRRSSCLGMSASPPTPDVSLRGNEPTLRANNRRRRSAAVLSVDHRTAAVLQRTESLIRWNGGAQLVVVARIF
jgi:hypothetical protein